MIKLETSCLIGKMLGSEITSIIKKDLKLKNYFRGVFASDTLPTSLERGKTHAIVVNLDKISQPGSHWCAIFIASNGYCIYFDPLGIPPFVPSILSFIEKNSTFYQWNDMIIQSLLSYTCGFYVIFFLRKVIRGVTLRRFQSYFKKLNYHYNDNVVCQLYNNKF